MSDRKLYIALLTRTVNIHVPVMATSVSEAIGILEECDMLLSDDDNIHESCVFFDPALSVDTAVIIDHQLNGNDIHLSDDQSLSRQTAAFNYDTEDTGEEDVEGLDEETDPYKLEEGPEDEDENPPKKA